MNEVRRREPRRVAVLVRVPETLKRELELQVQLEGVAQSEIVRRAIELYLREIRGGVAA